MSVSLPGLTEAEGYVATFNTCGLGPGYYRVGLDLPDGSSLGQVVEMVSS